MDKKELWLLADIKKMSTTSGGKQIVAITKKVCSNKIVQLANGFRDKSHIELVELCADLNANLDIYLLLTGIDDKIKAVEQILETSEADLDPFDQSNVEVINN